MCGPLQFTQGRKGSVGAKAHTKYIFLIKHLEAKKNDSDFPSQLKTGSCWRKKNKFVHLGQMMKLMGLRLLFAVYHTLLSGFIFLKSVLLLFKLLILNLTGVTQKDCYFPTALPE